jgi:hypothetical protein
MAGEFIGGCSYGIGGHSISFVNSQNRHAGVAQPRHLKQDEFRSMGMGRPIHGQQDVLRWVCLLRDDDGCVGALQ